MEDYVNEDAKEKEKRGHFVYVSIDDPGVDKYIAILPEQWTETKRLALNIFACF